MSEENPFQAPTYSDPAVEQFPAREYGGMNRGTYFGISLLYGIGNNIATRMAEAADSLVVLLILVVVSLVFAFYLASRRLVNMGYNPWWCLAMMVPLLNILVGVRCLACPEGYADHKTLDTAAKVIIGLFFALIAMMVLVVVLLVNG